jgi:uncharacterized protein (TIGR01777 family)
MRIVIPGGSGQVGTILARALHGAGHEVVILSRGAAVRPWRTAAWDGVTLGDWQRDIDGADVVINLAGRSVNCRYNPKNREDILHSRLASTRVVGEAIARSVRPPRVWLQASTATIYAHSLHSANDEHTGVIGGDELDAPDTWRFSTDVALAWEREFDRSVTPNTRKVTLRSAMTMSPDRGGVFDTLATLARRGLGGRVADGRQFISWIHEHDFVAAIRFLIDRDLAGVVNLAAPNPLPQYEFMRALRDECGAIAGLPASRWMLEFATLLMRTESELILKSRRVVPARLLEHGFAFRYPEWRAAAADLCDRWRAARHSSLAA